MKGAPTNDISILARLRNETRPEHEAIEGALDLMSDELTLMAYRERLKHFWGYYGPIEERLEKIGGWAEYGLDLTARRKAPWLEADLRALGVESPAAMRVCPNLPELTDIAQGFGCLYVLEGSTLGGQFISRHVRDLLSVTPEAGGRFFHGYGDGTGSKWRDFGVAITRLPADPPTAQRIVASAIETFQKLRSWFQEAVIQ